MTEPAPLPEVTFAIRPARETDHDFIHASFLESYRESEETNGIGNAVFFSVFKAEFVKIVERFTVLVAHPDGDPDEIAGWIAFSGRVLGWICTKKRPWRGMGVGRQLWNAAGLGIEASAIYACKRGMQLAKLKGLRIAMLPHGKVVRMLEGS